MDRFPFLRRSSLMRSSGGGGSSSSSSSSTSSGGSGTGASATSTTASGTTPTTSSGTSTASSNITSTSPTSTTTTTTTTTTTMTSSSTSGTSGSSSSTSTISGHSHEIKRKKKIKSQLIKESVGYSSSIIDDPSLMKRSDGSSTGSDSSSDKAGSGCMSGSGKGSSGDSNGYENCEFPEEGYKHAEWHYCLLHCATAPLDHEHFERVSLLFGGGLMIGEDDSTTAFISAADAACTVEEAPPELITAIPGGSRPRRGTDLEAVGLVSAVNLQKSSSLHEKSIDDDHDHPHDIVTDELGDCEMKTDLSYFARSISGGSSSELPTSFFDDAIVPTMGRLASEASFGGVAAGGLDLGSGPMTDRFSVGGEMLVDFSTAPDCAIMRSIDRLPSAASDPGIVSLALEDSTLDADGDSPMALSPAAGSGAITADLSEPVTSLASKSGSLPPPPSSAAASLSRTDMILDEDAPDIISAHHPHPPSAQRDSVPTEMGDVFIRRTSSSTGSTSLSSSSIMEKPRLGGRSTDPYTSSQVSGTAGSGSGSGSSILRTGDHDSTVSLSDSASGGGSSGGRGVASGSSASGSTPTSTGSGARSSRVKMKKAISFFSRFSLTKPSRSPSPSAVAGDNKSDLMIDPSDDMDGMITAGDGSVLYKRRRDIARIGSDYNKELSYLTDVLSTDVLEYILLFMYPFELRSGVALVSTRMNQAVEAVWLRYGDLVVSPMHFPSLQNDFRLWYHYKKSKQGAKSSRKRLARAQAQAAALAATRPISGAAIVASVGSGRTRGDGSKGLIGGSSSDTALAIDDISIRKDQLNVVLMMILTQVSQCRSLYKLCIYRTMITGPLLQQLCVYLPKLKELRLLENPLCLSGGDLEEPTMDFSLFRDDYQPKFKLESFYVRDMYPEISSDCLTAFLSSSFETLKSLVVFRKSPFECSYCHKMSLCKFHKCEVCEIRSYCSARCQRDDWQHHQLVCHSHDPKKTLRRISQSKTLDQIASTISMCTSLTHLDLSYTFVSADLESISRIAFGCKNLTEVKMNGCDMSSAALAVLAENLNLQLFHCRMARSLTDTGIYALIDNCSDSLEDIDLSRCICVKSGSILEMVQRCHKLRKVNIACGMKRGAWMWGVNDTLAEALTSLSDVTYIGYIDSGEMSQEWKVQMLAPRRPGLDLTADCLRSSVRFVQQFQPREDLKPVTSQRIVNGHVEAETTFRR